MMHHHHHQQQQQPYAYPQQGAGGYGVRDQYPPRDYRYEDRGREYSSGGYGGRGPGDGRDRGGGAGLGSGGYRPSSHYGPNFAPPPQGPSAPRAFVMSPQPGFLPPQPGRPSPQIVMVPAGPPGSIPARLPYQMGPNTVYMPVPQQQMQVGGYPVSQEAGYYAPRGPFPGNYGLPGPAYSQNPPQPKMHTGNVNTPSGAVGGTAGALDGVVSNGVVDAARPGGMPYTTAPAQPVALPKKTPLVITRKDGTIVNPLAAVEKSSVDAASAPVAVSVGGLTLEDQTAVPASTTQPENVTSEIVSLTVSAPGPEPTPSPVSVPSVPTSALSLEPSVHSVPAPAPAPAPLLEPPASVPREDESAPTHDTPRSEAFSSAKSSHGANLSSSSLALSEAEDSVNPPPPYSNASAEAEDDDYSSFCNDSHNGDDGSVPPYSSQRSSTSATPSLSNSASHESLTAMGKAVVGPALSTALASIQLQQQAGLTSKAVKEEDEDEWEKNVQNLEVPNVARVVQPAVSPAASLTPSTTPPQRSLRPGGGSAMVKLNAGALNAPKGPKREYSREDIIRLRPSQLPERPAICVTMYSQVTDPLSKERKAITGFWLRPSAGVSPQRGDYRSRDSGSVGGGGGGGGYRDGHQPGESGGERWDRGKQGLPPIQDSRGPGGGRGKKPAGPRPVKEVIDPVEKLINDVRAILNKITPQSFEKLTDQLCQIPIGTNPMLDKLIELVFEKAVNEPNFANLYSDMCHALEKQSRHWGFLQIVHLRDTNEYTWVQDLDVDNDISGPFDSAKDAIADVLSESPMGAKPQSIKVNIDEVSITTLGPCQVLLKVYTDGSLAPNTQYFVSCEEYIRENVQLFEKSFETKETAGKQAIKKNSVRNRLLYVCQNEFQSAVDRVGEYDLQPLRDKINEHRKNQLEDARLALEAELEEKEFKVKRRMLGNVRFIGELFKKGMMQAQVMHQIIKALSCIVNDQDEPVAFKDPVPEYDLEMLCKLLHTTGAMLEEDARSKKERGAQFNWYFNQIFAISKNKNYSSRIRFSLDEVLELRRNYWNARRKEEGPATIEAIHAKAAQEEAARALASQQGRIYDPRGQVHGSPGVRPGESGGGRPPLGGSGGPKGGMPPTPKLLARAQDARQAGGNTPASGGKGKSGGASPLVSGSKKSAGPSGGSQSQHGSQGSNSKSSSDKAGGGGAISASSATASGGNSAPASQPAAKAASGTDIVEAIKAKALVDKVGSSVREFTNVGDLEEVKLVLKDLPSASLGTMVQVVVREYIATKPAEDAKRSKLFELLSSLAEELATHLEEVKAAVSSCDELLNLNDTMVDSQQVRHLKCSFQSLLL